MRENYAKKGGPGFEQSMRSAEGSSTDKQRQECRDEGLACFVWRKLRTSGHRPDSGPASRPSSGLFAGRHNSAKPHRPPRPLKVSPAFASVTGSNLAPPASQQAPQGRAGVLPGVYRQARSACRCIREAAARQSKDAHYLRLDDRAFLQVYQAVEHDRSRTRKAIGKGLAKPGDLRASDPLWQILQDAMTKRCRKAWGLS